MIDRTSTDLPSTGLTSQGPVLAITGPTASGKTALSLPLARELGGEIISVDSRQLYRGMDIGTAKVTSDERKLVPHHGLDLVPPAERFSAGAFARAARTWVRDIRSRGQLPLLVGGTGFFFKALAQPIFREPPLDPRRRTGVEAFLGGLEPHELARWVQVLDPSRLEVARAGGPQRMIRTLEVALLTGRPLSWWHEHAPAEAQPLPMRTVLLTLPREELYGRINRRAADMFADGLVEEVAGLLARGADPEDPGMTGTGYREAVRVLDGSWTEAEALESVQQATRRYARRQITWFRHQMEGDVLEVDATTPLSEQLDSVLRWWRRPDPETGTGTGHPGVGAAEPSSPPTKDCP